MKSIGYDRQSFLIDGARRILLIGTVNYFRIHPDDWAHRLRLFRESGFNTVDVYVAWGYHEPTEGRIDFDSPARDLDRYLTLCDELGLFVYLRPGPYICNEFDGGGLPPWLFQKPGVEIRQNESNYLAIVRRYLTSVNQIAVRHQRTRGGPIILYAIENELDFYPTREVASYMSALRDHVRADGIDVPITACIGHRTPVERAMGLIDDVIPTPNIYVNGERVESEAAKAIGALRGARSITGKPYEVPPFVTEMGRDENSLRRILSVGFKGLGPFNFAGGSNWDRYHAVNNWGDYKQLTTSIDFGGMIRFDGTIDQTYFNARRLARFIECVEPDLATSSPAQESVRVIEGDLSLHPHTLASDTGTFVFLPNLSETPVPLALEVGGQRVPHSGTMLIPGGKTPIVTAGLSLKRFGIDARIAHCTAEFWSLAGDTNRLLIELLLRAGQSGEIAFESSDGANPDPIPLSAGLSCTIALGEARVHLRVLDEAIAEQEGMDDQLELCDPINLMAGPWSCVSLTRPNAAQTWTGALRSLDSLGVYHGAGEYETEIQSDEPIRSLGVDYAADQVALWVEDRFYGTVLADGNRWKAEVDLAAGRHRVRIRATCWGRPCFHEEKWPASRLGTPRGLVGAFHVNGAPVDASWRFAADPIAPPACRINSGSVSLTDLRVRGGEAVVVGWKLHEGYPHGAVLEFDGHDLDAIVHVEDSGVARFGFGSIYRFTGGPADRVLLPGGLLRKGAMLSMTLRGTQVSEGRFDRLALRPLGRTAPR